MFEHRNWWKISSGRTQFRPIFLRCCPHSSASANWIVHCRWQAGQRMRDRKRPSLEPKHQMEHTNVQWMTANLWGGGIKRTPAGCSFPLTSTTGRNVQTTSPLKFCLFCIPSGSNVPPQGLNLTSCTQFPESHVHMLHTCAVTQALLATCGFLLAHPSIILSYPLPCPCHAPCCLPLFCDHPTARTTL